MTESFVAGQCWWMPLIPVLRRQRYEHYYEFDASLVYKANSSTSVSKKTQREAKIKKEIYKENNKKSMLKSD